MCRNSFHKKKSKPKKLQEPPETLYTFSSIHCSHSFPFLKTLSANYHAQKDASISDLSTHSGTRLLALICLEPGSLDLLWCLLLVSLLSSSGFWKPLQYKFSHLERVSWGASKKCKRQGLPWWSVAGTSFPNAGVPSWSGNWIPTRHN